MEPIIFILQSGAFWKYCPWLSVGRSDVTSPWCAPLRFRKETFHSAPGPTTCSCSCSFIRVTTTWASNTIWLPTSISGKCSTGRMHGLIIEDNRVDFCGCSRHAFFLNVGRNHPLHLWKWNLTSKKLNCCTTNDLVLFTVGFALQTFTVLYFAGAEGTLLRLFWKREEKSGDPPDGLARVNLLKICCMVNGW